MNIKNTLRKLKSKKQAILDGGTLGIYLPIKYEPYIHEAKRIGYLIEVKVSESQELYPKRKKKALLVTDIQFSLEGIRYIERDWKFMFVVFAGICQVSDLALKIYEHLQ